MDDNGIMDVTRPDSPASGTAEVKDTPAARGVASLHRDEAGATTLEWALLLAAIGLPSYYIFQLALATLVGHYQLITTVNALPFP